MDQECDRDSRPVREISISRTLDRDPNRSLITEQIDVNEGGAPSRILRSLNIPCDENPGECGPEEEEQPRTVGQNIAEREGAAHNRYLDELANRPDDECLYNVSAPLDFTGASFNWNTQEQSTWLMNFSEDEGGSERNEECLAAMRQNLGQAVSDQDWLANYSQGQGPGVIEEIQDFMLDYDEGAGYQPEQDDDLMYFSQGDLMEFSENQTNQSQGVGGGGGGGVPEVRQECVMDLNQTQEPSPETRRYLEEVRRRTQTPPAAPEPPRQHLRPDVQYIRERERATQDISPRQLDEHLQFLEAEHYVERLEKIRNMELAEEEKFEEAKCMLNQSIRNPQRLQEELQFLSAEHEAKMACFQNIRCTLERPAVMVTPRPEGEEIAEEPPTQAMQRRRISIVTPTTLAEMANQAGAESGMPPPSPGRPPTARRASVCTPQGRPSGPAAATTAARSVSADRAAAVKAAREKYAKMKSPSVESPARRSSVCTPQGRASGIGAAASAGRSASADRAAAVKAAREKYAKMKPPSVETSARRSSVCTPQGRTSGPPGASTAAQSEAADRAAAVKAAREKYAKMKPPSVEAPGRRSSVCTPQGRPPFGSRATVSAGRSVSADRAAAIKAAREKYAKIKPPSAQLPPERRVAAQIARRQVCSAGAARRPSAPDTSARAGHPSRRRLLGELELASQSAGPAARAALEQLPRHVCPGTPALQQQAKKEYTQAVERAKNRIQDPQELNSRLTSLKEEYQTKLGFICRLKELKGVAYQRFVQEFEELDTEVDDAEERRAMVDFLSDELDAYISHLHDVVGAERRQAAMSTCKRGSRPSLPRPVTPPPVIRKPTAQQIAEIKKRYTIKPGAPLPAPQPNIGPPTKTAQKLQAERCAAVAERRRRASEPNPVAAARAKYIHDPGTKFESPKLVMKPKLPKSAPCKKVSAQELRKSLTDLKRRYTLAPGQQLPGTDPRLGEPSQAALKLKAERIAAAAECKRRASEPSRIQEARRKFSAPGIGLQQEPGARRPSATNMQTKAMRKILAQKCAAAAERQQKGSAASRIAEARKRFSAPGMGLQQAPGARRPSATGAQTKAMRKILAQKCAAAAERQQKGSAASRIAEARKRFSAPGMGLQQAPGARRPSATGAQTKAMRKILAQKCAAAAEHQRRASEGSRIAEARKKYMNISKTKLQTPSKQKLSKVPCAAPAPKPTAQQISKSLADIRKKYSMGPKQKFSMPPTGRPSLAAQRVLEEKRAFQAEQSRKAEEAKRVAEARRQFSLPGVGLPMECSPEPLPEGPPAQLGQMFVRSPPPNVQRKKRVVTRLPTLKPKKTAPTQQAAEAPVCAKQPVARRTVAAQPAASRPSQRPAATRSAIPRSAIPRPAATAAPCPTAPRPGVVCPVRAGVRPTGAQPRPAPAQRATGIPRPAMKAAPCPPAPKARVVRPVQAGVRPTGAQPRPAPAQRATGIPRPAVKAAPCPPAPRARVVRPVRTGVQPTGAQPRPAPGRAIPRPAATAAPCPMAPKARVVRPIRAGVRPTGAQPRPAPAQRATGIPQPAVKAAPCPPVPRARVVLPVRAGVRPPGAQLRPAPAKRAVARPTGAQPSRLPCPAKAKSMPSKVPVPKRGTVAAPKPKAADKSGAKSTVPESIARAMESKNEEDIKRMNDELKKAAYQKKKKMEKLPPTVKQNLSKRVAAEMGPKSAIEKEETDGVYKSMMLEKRGVDLKSDPKKVAPRLIPNNAKKLKVIGNALESISEGVITNRVPTSNINRLDNVAAEEIAITLGSQLKKPAKGDVARKALGDKQFNIQPSGGGGEPPDNDYYECDVILDKLNATNQFQARGSALPKWFPGYYSAYPIENPNLLLQKSPSDAFIKAWQLMKPEFLNKSR